MGVSFVYFSALSLLVLWNVAITSASANEVYPTYPNLKLFVTVEGKSYFVDDLKLTWFDAERRCRSVGMYLANITSANQYTALKNAHAEQKPPDNLMWIAAKDSETLSQFAWMYSGDNLDDDYLKLGGYMTIRQTCLYFGGGDNLGRHTCHDDFYMVALCQTIAV